jgi:hypothetical protein
VDRTDNTQAYQKCSILLPACATAEAATAMGEGLLCNLWMRFELFLISFYLHEQTLVASDLMLKYSNERIPLRSDSVPILLCSKGKGVPVLN